MARDIIEFLTEVDYNKYFDSMGGPGSKGGEREASFSKFSLQAVKAAEVTHICIIGPGFHGFFLKLGVFDKRCTHNNLLMLCRTRCLMAWVGT